ncbi:MAG: class I SAM-dependent methyltransferase [Balneolaceae bacterium]
MPDQEFLKIIAAQLRKPSGELGNEVAEKMNESNREMNLATINSLEIKDGESILEIGMGNGFFVKHILSKAERLHYIGCDYSEDMVTLSTKLNQQLINSGEASFLHADAHNLPIENQSIDHLFTINTLYFWENIEVILKEFKRVLKSNATLCITIRPESCLKQYPSTQYNFNYYSIDSILDSLLKNGFNVTDIIEQKEPEVEVLEKKIIPEFIIFIAQNY